MTVTAQQYVNLVMTAVTNHDPYVFGGISLVSGADCSGELYEASDELGLPHEERTSQEMFKVWPVAPGPALGVAVFFYVNSDGPASEQPGHVGLCLNATTMEEEPHTGLDAEVVRIPNIPGVESIMGYRFVPGVTYGTPATTTTAPAKPTTSPSIPQEVIMGLPTGCTDQQAVFAQIKEWWITFRTDECTVEALDDLWLAWNLPTAQKGFAGSPFLLFSNIIDGVPGDPAPLRPQFAGAV